jgi:hypothetical protein
MVDEYNGNPRDELEERFMKLEAQVSNISFNMVMLMETLEAKVGLLGSLVALI